MTGALEIGFRYFVGLMSSVLGVTWKVVNVLLMVSQTWCWVCVYEIPKTYLFVESGRICEVGLGLTRNSIKTNLILLYLS